MSDTYQPVYDAVRSRLSGCDTGDAVYRAARECFDFGIVRDMAHQEVLTVSHEMQRPSVLFRPGLSLDGDSWCALYGANLAEGVAGFGPSPSAAMYDFDRAWNAKVSK